MSERAYVDSSALVKLVGHERESVALRGRIADLDLVSSALARVEVVRAVRRSGVTPGNDPGEVLSRTSLVGIDDEVLDLAGRLDPGGLRSLDAIHLATAILVAEDLDLFVTYDRQLAAAAERAGFPVEAPR